MQLWSLWVPSLPTTTQAWPEGVAPPITGSLGRSGGAPTTAMPQRFSERVCVASQLQTFAQLTDDVRVSQPGLLCFNHSKYSITIGGLTMEAIIVLSSPLFLPQGSRPFIDVYRLAACREHEPIHTPRHTLSSTHSSLISNHTHLAPDLGHHKN